MYAIVSLACFVNGFIYNLTKIAITNCHILVVIVFVGVLYLPFNIIRSYLKVILSCSGYFLEYLSCCSSVVAKYS